MECTVDIIALINSRFAAHAWRHSGQQRHTRNETNSRLRCSLLLPVLCTLYPRLEVSCAQLTSAVVAPAVHLAGPVEQQHGSSGRHADAVFMESGASHPRAHVLSTNAHLLLVHVPCQSHRVLQTTADLRNRLSP